jgi:hypothetical protein
VFARSGRRGYGRSHKQLHSYNSQHEVAAATDWGGRLHPRVFYNICSKSRGGAKNAEGTIYIFPPWRCLLPHIPFQYSMPPTICPIAQQNRKCRNVQCRMWHDIVLCKPCECFVLRERLTRHRRGEEHRRNCHFPERKGREGLAFAIPGPSLPYPGVPEPSRRKAADPGRQKKTTGGRPAKRSRGDRGLAVSQENGLTLGSAAGKEGTFTAAMAPILIKRVVCNETLMLTDVELTGAGSGS